ncbi:MAG: bifunctional 2-C-methyl-D-erythritol 4-phosphate cytidylyltransferase/2-C-methyl-D-erythritol 2,4-cyclodiphosphate synthase [Pseudomonadota bacterium]
MMNAPTIAIIVAAGRGARAGAGGPKQYRPLAGRTVLARTVDAFLKHPQIDFVRIIIHRDDGDEYARAIDDVAARDKLLEPVNGGAERQDSVRLGLESLKERNPACVLIHDAARPFVDAETISRVIAALDTHDGAIAALPVHDTIKRALDKDAGASAARIDTTVPRDALWRAQTPQGFKYDLIIAAHEKAAGETLTDDAAVAEAAGLAVALVPGAPDNMKITQAEDFGMAETLLSRQASREATLREYRTGSGYDVHAFEPGDKVTLCGVDIDHDAKLKGHSDADVGMHALTDAIMGAIAEGDIGDHFPPSDPQWKGAPSDVFLKKARDLVLEKGGAITHCDVTLICEAPKIGPHRAAMRARLAEILAIDEARISVKATTSEELGFTGRREGIASLATATVALPLTA